MFREPRSYPLGMLEELVGTVLDASCLLCISLATLSMWSREYREGNRGRGRMGEGGGRGAERSVRVGEGKLGQKRAGRKGG